MTMPQATISTPLTHSSASVRYQDLDPDVKPTLERLQRLPGDDPRRRRLRNSVVERALPLADRLARRFEHRGEPLEDLTQVARLGLVKAVNNYRAGRGDGFTRFAIPSILGEIKRHFRDKGWLVRVPRRMQETRLAFADANQVLSQRLRREPSVADYAQYLNLPQEQVRAGFDCAGAYDGVSLQAPAHRDATEALIDALGANDPAMESAEARLMLRPAIQRLSQRERTILALRFDLDLHQREIADRIGLSQMHVSRLLRRALSKLRDALDA
ncbi:MAG: SigB/SigF/SigG family RNA polymerase sigma factor [Stackebrandtia sp.]